MDKREKDKLIIAGGLIIVVILTLVLYNHYKKKHIANRGWQYFQSEDFRVIYDKLNTEKSEVIFEVQIFGGFLITAKTKDKEEYKRMCQEVEHFDHPDWVNIIVVFEGDKSEVYMRYHNPWYKSWGMPLIIMLSISFGVYIYFKRISKKGFEENKIEEKSNENP